MEDYTERQVQALITKTICFSLKDDAGINKQLLFKEKCFLKIPWLFSNLLTWEVGIIWTKWLNQTLNLSIDVNLNPYT